MQQDVATTCKYCGRPLESGPGRRSRQYCNDTHRQADFRRRRKRAERDERLRAVRALGDFLPETHALLESLLDLSPELAQRVAQAIATEVEAAHASQPKRDEAYVTLTAEEMAHLPDWYRDNDPEPRAFKAWLGAQYPEGAGKPSRPQPRRSRAPRGKPKELDAPHTLALRLLSDQRIPERATKNEYLAALQRSGYSGDDLRVLHNLWMQWTRQQA